MPNRTSLIWAGAFALLAVFYWQREQAMVTATHSQPHTHSHKMTTLKPDMSPDDRHTMKVTGPISVTLSLDGPPPQVVGDTYTVRGQVLSDQNLNNLTCKWILPKNVELISGVKDSFHNVTANVPLEVKLVLRAKAAGPQKVQLRAAATQGRSRFAASGFYTNAPPPKPTIDKEIPSINPEESSDQKSYQ